MKVNKTLQLLIIIPIMLSLQLPKNYNPNYELSYPLRYLYYRLNAKLEINPMLAHLSHLNDNNRNIICSSRTGPFCQIINDKQLQQYSLSTNTLQQKEKLAYSTQKAYLSYRQKLARGIETGEVANIFLVASQEYKTLDNIIKTQLSPLLYSSAQIASKQQDKLEDRDTKQDLNKFNYDERELTLEEINKNK